MRPGLLQLKHPSTEAVLIRVKNDILRTYDMGGCSILVLLHKCVLYLTLASSVQRHARWSELLCVH